MVEKAFRKLAERSIDDDLHGDECKILRAVDFGIPNDDGTGGDGSMERTMHSLRVSSAKRNEERKGLERKREDTLEDLFGKMLRRAVPSIIDQHVRSMGGYKGGSGGAAGTDVDAPSSTPLDLPDDTKANTTVREREQMAVQVQVLEKEEEEEEEEEEEREAIETKEKNQIQVKVKELQKVALKDLGMGICPASFDWLLGTENYWEQNGMGTAESVNKDMACQVCARPWHIVDGYRCTGGTHFFCGACVIDKTKEYKKDAMKKAKAENARTNYSTF